MFYGLMLSPGSILAADIPQFQQQVSLQAVEQSVPAFIESLFSQIGVPVKVNSQIPGSVNGAFNGTAEEVFSHISQAFNVFLYYDKTAHRSPGRNLLACIIHEGFAVRFRLPSLLV